MDYCRALSAAIFSGDASKVDFVDLPTADRFIALATGMVDVLASVTTITLDRDIEEQTSRTGFSFSQPYYYEGLSFGAIKP